MNSETSQFHIVGTFEKAPLGSLSNMTPALLIQAKRSIIEIIGEAFTPPQGAGFLIKSFSPNH